METRVQRTSPRLLVATTSAGKLREYISIFTSLEWELIRPADIGVGLEVDETGTTFVENARLKAWAYFEATRMPTFAEDSGLEIDALGGAPGIYSARFHGLPDGPLKNAHVLELLSDIPPDRRGCRYRCAIVFIDRDAREFVFEGSCAGSIALQPSGEAGFGFDPIVVVQGRGCTMAELREAEKNRTSHRGIAARKLIEHLRQHGLGREGGSPAAGSAAYRRPV